MFLIIGTRYFTWGSDQQSTPSRCQQCGTVGQFLIKKGIHCVTLFFVLPILPLSGVKTLLQCPNCKARYNLQQIH